MIPPALIFFLRIIMTFGEVLCILMNFRIYLSIAMRNDIKILMGIGIALNL
jgi:hypothetical protein